MQPSATARESAKYKKKKKNPSRDLGEVGGRGREPELPEQSQLAGIAI